MTPEQLAHAAVDCLDETALAMERKWGIDRLPLLVDHALAAKFAAQRGKLNDALASGRPDAIAAHASAMERAWKALDAAATASGASVLSPEVWEAITPSGEVVAIVRTPAEAAHVAKQRGGAVYTVAEVAVALDAFGDKVRAVKDAFPGASVTAVRSRELSIGSASQAPPRHGNPRPRSRRGAPVKGIQGMKTLDELLDEPGYVTPFNDEIPF